MNRRGLRPSVVHGDPHENVVRTRRSEFEEYVEVAIVVEDPGVEQLEFGLVLAPSTVLVQKLRAASCGR